MELEEAISKLPPAELSQFTEWFEEFKADQWDRQIERDAKNGKLDHLAKRADEAFERGECSPL